MAILNDREIKFLAYAGMISPFVETQRGKGVISFGLSSFGYDARVDRQFKIFTLGKGIVLDPKDFSASAFEDHVGDHCIIPPNSFALGRTVEKFNIPRNIFAICMGKSTYARVGIIVNVTPLEPEWRGHVTLEFSNTTQWPVKIYAGEGACQFIFMRGNKCAVSYADRKGKYQDQIEVTLPRIK
jgi:dCTP deaminase